MVEEGLIGLIEEERFTSWSTSTQLVPINTDLYALECKGSEGNLSTRYTYLIYQL